MGRSKFELNPSQIPLAKHPNQGEFKVGINKMKEIRQERK